MVDNLGLDATGPSPLGRSAERTRRMLALRFVEWSAAEGLRDFREAPTDWLEGYHAELTRAGLPSTTHRIYLWAAREILASAGRGRA